MRRDGVAGPLARQAAARNARSRGDRAYKTRRFGRVVNCHCTFMHENLMDMDHQFLHRRTTERSALAILCKRSGEGWMELDYNFRRAGERPRAR